MREFHLRHTTLCVIAPVASGSYRQGAEPNLTLRAVSEGRV